MPVHPLLVERARRIKALRQRLVAAVLASFVLAWGAVVWDGSMGSTTTSTAQLTTTVEATATAAPRTSEDSPDSLTTTQS